jgi:hypothetical protein
VPREVHPQVVARCLLEVVVVRFHDPIVTVGDPGLQVIPWHEPLPSDEISCQQAQIRAT